MLNTKRRPHNSQVNVLSVHVNVCMMPKGLQAEMHYL